LGRLEVGRGKWLAGKTKVAISVKCIKIGEKLLWTAYRNSPTLFRTVPFSTPCGLHFTKIGGFATPTQTAIENRGKNECR